MQTPVQAPAQNPQEYLAFLRRLRAVRLFRPDPVPQVIVDDLLRVARWSGSARNAQPWEFVLVRDRAMLQQLGAAEGHAQHVAGAALALVLVMAGTPERMAQETFDEGRLSERIMLAAEAHGLGSCIGWWFNDGQTTAKQLLGIPPNKLVRTVLSIGYADENAGRARPKPAQARKPLAALVHEERYSGTAGRETGD